ncbi:MAG: amino acid adenylation domain-containing protein [Acidobacteria bacterium]|nr:amino acid adenylation domain-containing protein [Acidobacteriota bacterium]
MNETKQDVSDPIEPIAIIGMSARIPGASNVTEFWNNQLRGLESISRFSVEELEIENREEIAAQSNYVSARSILKDIDLFDAEFFGILPKEAELMDPQQRLFLECCWEGLESAGYNPFNYRKSIGVFAGTSYSSYFLSRVCSAPDFPESFTSQYQIGNYPAMMGNLPDFMATRVSYKLNLRGPSFTMVSACSTSLLAVCQACESLLSGQSDMALAGGVSITLPQKRGYLYTEGGIGSADGHTRSFDQQARGTVFGSGIGIVLLKRLKDALAEGDTIHSVIRGFAVNNDGAARIGYTAPGIDGQADVIARAHRSAGINPETIGYLEAHGTGTPLGDPIELSAATRAFRLRTDKKHFCAIGTAKTNVGHLDVAAGVTGLIHATHIVREGQFPPTLHFEKPTSKFDFGSSPFYVNTEVAEWKADQHPRRAGISAFGVGGTNVHVIIEEPPAIRAISSSRAKQLLILSARSSKALDIMSDNLSAHLAAHPEMNLADVAFTLSGGRKAFPHRRYAIAESAAEAATVLAGDRRKTSHEVRNSTPKVAFLFPGQGSQRPNMGRAIYESEPIFRDAVDRCDAHLKSSLGQSLIQALYPKHEVDEADCKITQTLLAQPAIFTIEYALAQLWMSWGVLPRYMIGHSIGEFVAACLAGVFSLEDALHLVAARGRMMQSLPAGAMLSVRLDHHALVPYLGEASLAAINGPSLSVAAGSFEAIGQLESALNRDNIAHRRLHTSHAFHSSMMEPILEPFLAEVSKITLHAPNLPYISSVTGDWITPELATDPQYWARHFRQPVQFSAGISKLREIANSILLEVGPGNVLSTLARQHASKASSQVVVSSLAASNADEKEDAVIHSALGQLWLAGADINWDVYHTAENRHRVTLPTYPFERKSFWIEKSEPRSPITPHPQTDIATVTTSVEQTPAQEPNPVNLPNSSAQSNHKHKLCAEVGALIEEMSGLTIAPQEYGATFLDLGLDSLFLTQATQSLQKKFGVKVTFRQLLSDIPTIDALGDFLAANVPAPQESVQPQQPIAAMVSAPMTQVAPASTTPGAPAELLQQMMLQQMAAMNQMFAQQLAALQGSTSTGLIQAPAPALQIAVQPSSNSPATADQSDKELKGYTPFKPVQRNLQSDLSPKQEAGIRKIVSLYCKRTAKSKELTQHYRKVHADPRVVAGFRAPWKEMIYPLITNRSQGAYLWDADGNQYIDVLNGFGPIMLGHRPDFIVKALEQQLEQGFEIGPQTLLAGEVAQMISEMTGNERVTFCNTGSEAVIAAMRVARTVTGRSKVVIFAGDYHGMFDEVLMKGFKRGGEPQSVPAAPGIPREKAANMVVLEYGAQDSLDWISKNASELAAVIVEPVQSRHPDLQPIDFLRELRAITEASGTCFVFDEVVTGFRAHPGGCQALFNIRADLATYGKVLAGGMPIGVLAGKSQYMDALDGGMWQYGDDSYPEIGVTFFAGTFVRHPLTMAATKAMLQHLKAAGPQLQQGLTARTASLVNRLKQLLESNEVPAHIENFASVFYFSFSPDARFGSLFYYLLRAKGIHLLEGFPCFLTTAHTDADLDRIVAAFAETIAEMQASDLLPAPPVDGPRIPTRKLQNDVTPFIAEAPLTESQREIWLSAQLSDEASCAFNESFTLYLDGEFDRARMELALQKLIERHDALRASISNSGEKMTFSPKATLALPYEDISSLEPALRDQQLKAAIALEARMPFNLAHAPLLRVRIFKTDTLRHALIFTGHHIVCDGWSINVMLEEISSLYTGRVLDPQASFGAYTLTKSKEQEDTANSEYWAAQFPDVPVLDLPTDRPRPAVKSYPGDTCRMMMDAAATKLIRNAGAKQGCTLFVTLLSGFASLLHRLSAQSDIVIGIPTAGQSLLENSMMVGHDVNFLPIRTQLTDDLTAASLLTQTKKTLLNAYEHQNYTYGTLIRKLKLHKDVSRLPLIEVQFNLEKVGSNLNFGELQAKVDSNPKAAVNFDLFLNIVETPNGLVLDCDFNTDLFDRETVIRWLRCYETLLQGIAQDPTRLIDELPILPVEEEHRLVHEWNTTASEYPRGCNVHELFEHQVERTPDAVAVRFDNTYLTYAQLDRRANQLASYLTELGIHPGDLVGLQMDRSLDLPVALLGIWKSGAAYVPLDPTYPKERLDYIVKETSVPVLITQQRFADTMSDAETQLVLIDSEWTTIERQPAEGNHIRSDAERNAYVMFTSGSTGKPKGVEVTHQNLVNFLLSIQKTPGMTSQDRLLAVTSISFDISGLELYLPLITGAEVIISSREMAADARLIIRALEKSAITIMQATPATWRMMIESGWNGTKGIKALCGGEALPHDLATQLISRGVELWNMYGPTETTIWSAVAHIDKTDSAITLGTPIANTQLYVLSAAGQLQPIGVPGELYIGGDGVARGYFKRPDLTKERFVKHSFHDEEQRLYRTGDLVRYRTDGRLEFLGRLDHQVKVRGFRIELGEIESSLLQHPRVQQAVVIAREDIPGDKRLAAYVVLTAGEQLAATDMRLWVSRTLPDYMVPSHFAFLPELPQTPNGKVDRKRLPAPQINSAAGQHVHVAPRTPAEEKLSRIAAEVLNIKQVSVDQSLFDLGADSIHLFQIVARARSQEMNITPQQILKLRSVAAIAAEVTQQTPISSDMSKAGELKRINRDQYRVHLARN